MTVTIGEKVYLGDGVYVQYEDRALTLTSENGLQVLNRIVLEDDVYVALLKYVGRLRHPRREGT